MPEKSVREMGALERAHYSLAGRVFRSVVIGAAVLGLVAFLIGMGLYTYSLVQQNIVTGFSLAKSAKAVIDEVADGSELSNEVVKIYHGLTQKQRDAQDTEEYRAFFAPVTESENYQLIRSVLNDFLEGGDVDDIYFAVYDRETSALIYLADPDESGIYQPGTWDSIEEKVFDKFLNWDGTGRLYQISRDDDGTWLCTTGVQVRGRDGQLAGFILSDISLVDVAKGMKNFLLQYIIAITLATILMAYFFTRHMKKSLVAPINAIADAAGEYVRDQKAGVRNTDHFSMLNIRTGDEVENLSLVMADMENDLAEYEDSLTKAISEKERVSTELNMATQIQEGMLPSIYPAFPDRNEFDIFATMDPAREVGGDFFDFFLVDDDHLCMIMADVSGKGVPAALFMMASKIILQTNAKMGKSPAKILEDTNASICANNRMEMFVTVWLGILEISTGKLVAANAGHEYPALKQNDRFNLFKDKHGFVIGGMAGMKYKEYELQLQPGDKLFLYTDGVPEATDANNQLFGTDRMLEALNADPETVPAQVLTNVRRKVDGFVKNAEQFDDLTMLCMEYKGER